MAETRRLQRKHDRAAHLTVYETPIYKDVTSRIYEIDLRTHIVCGRRRRITIKKTKSKVKKALLNFFQIPQLLKMPIMAVNNVDIPKTAQFVENLQKYMDGRKVYTYCLNGGVLVMAETSHTSKLQDKISKHVLLCKTSAACVSGEARFRSGHLVFNNLSGTYKPRPEQLNILHKALSFAEDSIVLEGRTVAQ